MKVLWSWLTFYWFQECYNTFYLSPDNKQNESTSFLIDSVIYFFWDTLCVYILIFMHLCFSFGSHPPPPPPSPAPTTPAREFQVKIHCCGFTWFTFSSPLPWVWGPPWIQEHCKVSFDNFLICFKPISRSPGTCGRALVLERIVGGQNAELGQYPWLVNLGYTRKAGNWKWIIFSKSSVGSSKRPDFNPPKPDSLEATKDNNFTKALQPKFNCGGTLIGPRFVFCPTVSFSSSLPLHNAPAVN